LVALLEQLGFKTETKDLDGKLCCFGHLVSFDFHRLLAVSKGKYIKGEDKPFNPG
jgi:hypothetical protein